MECVVVFQRVGFSGEVDTVDLCLIEFYYATVWIFLWAMEYQLIDLTSDSDDSITYQRFQSTKKGQKWSASTEPKTNEAAIVIEDSTDDESPTKWGLKPERRPQLKNEYDKHISPFPVPAATGLRQAPSNPQKRSRSVTSAHSETSDDEPIPYKRIIVAKDESLSPIRPKIRSENVGQISSPQRKAPGLIPERINLAQPLVSSDSRHGAIYTREEDQLLWDLKAQGTLWRHMVKHFHGRSFYSLQTRYSNKLAGKPRPRSRGAREVVRQGTKLAWHDGPTHSQGEVDDGEEDKQDDERQTRLHIRNRTSQNRIKDYINSVKHSADVCSSEKANGIMDMESSMEDGQDEINEMTCLPEYQLDRLAKARRRLELGSIDHTFPSNINELCNYGYGSLGPTMSTSIASGDVATLAWSAGGEVFAAGCVALSDPDSMQYNMSNNLIIGNSRSSIVRELPEHVISAPKTATTNNDQKLFTTVQHVEFSPCNQYLHSVCVGGKLNTYGCPNEDIKDVHFIRTYQHSASADLMSVGLQGLIATASHTANQAINVFKSDMEEPIQNLFPKQSKSVKPRPLHVSALKWGIAPHQSRYLLAGFAQEQERIYIEDSMIEVSGQVCLYNMETAQAVNITNSNTGNVFDVAWNPNLGPTAFAVACVGTRRLGLGMHTAIRLFGQHGSNALRDFVELECPAYDINDVIYCPYDDNLVAAGTTDGKVYVWDIRKSQAVEVPSKSLGHGDCVGVLAHDRYRWEVDTGVRFLSWGVNHTSLFSGSSDGVVKLWNPYLSQEDCSVKDVIRLNSAVMAGSFSPNFEKLLIGEDHKTLTLLEIGHGTEDDEGSGDVAARRLFEYIPTKPNIESIDERSKHQEMLDSGEIIFAHGGSLPIRQAVQGPNYHKFHHPSISTQDQAELYARAAVFQNGLWHQRNRWKKLEKKLGKPIITPCQLDCDYKPSDNDPNGPVEDNERSFGRIPDNLSNPSKQSIGTFIRSSNCIECGTSIKSKNTDTTALCEACGFDCLHCGKPAQVDFKAYKVVCEHCSGTWSIGCLGYDVLESNHAEDGSCQEKTFLEDQNNFGDELRLHYLDCTTLPVNIIL